MNETSRNDSKEDGSATELGLAGCYRLKSPVFQDPRGLFVKPIGEQLREAVGSAPVFRESFYTVSERNVLRGMHLQLPPADQEKLVYCVTGAILDVLVDLRRSSPTFGNHASLELRSDTANAVFVPKGVAHGFFVLSDPAIVMYHVTSHYLQNLDRGIHWNSFGMKWPTAYPMTSSRDSNLLPFSDFQSPWM